MKKVVLIETVFTQINGGRPNTDLSVQREDIAALLPAAVNYAMTGDYWANLQRDNDRELPGSFVAEFEITHTNCDEFGRDYFYFDKKISTLPGGAGIRYLQDLEGNNYSPRPIGAGKKSYFDNALLDLREYQFKESKFFLFNKPELVNKFLLGVILDVDDLSDEDELPLPAGTEASAIEILTALINGQRMNPKDYINNGIDPVNEVR